MTQKARVWVVLVVTLITLGCARETLARPYIFQTNGVTVRYTLPGAVAYFDENDQTLTVEIMQSGGSLTVLCPSRARLRWPKDYVDMYILAPQASIRSIRISASSTFRAYVTGDTLQMGTFSLSHGAIGGTDAYADRGIGMTSVTAPRTPLRTIHLTDAVTYGPIGGVDYNATNTTTTAAASNARSAASAPAKKTSKK